MDTKAKINPMRRALSFALAALLAFSLVPASAFASSSGQAAQESAGISVQNSEEPGGEQPGDVQGEEPSGDQGEEPSGGDEPESGQAATGTGEGDGQSADADAAASSQQAADSGAASGGGEKQDDEELTAEEGVENKADEADATAYGRSLLMTASARAIADLENPNTPVKVGQYAPGTYTVTANLYIPQDKNPLINIQAYATNPDNPLSIVEDNDPSLVTGAVPNIHMEDNAQLVVEEDGTLLLTVPVLNPVFTIQKIGDGDGIKVVDTAVKSGEYGPVGPNGTVARVDYESRISSVTFELSGSGYTSDGSHGYTLKNCTEYPTLLGRDWHVDLDLTVDFSHVPAADAYASDPIVNTLTYSGTSQKGVSFEEEKCEVVSGDVQAVNAGDYSVTLKPKQGFSWLDGSTEARSYDWSIGKAPLVKRYETVIPCGSKSAKEIIDALPSADEVNAGFEYDGFVGGDTAEMVEGLQTQTFVSWDLGKLTYAQMMPDFVPLASCVPAALRGTMSGEDADTANYDVKTEAVAHVTMCEDQEPEAFDVVYNGQHQLGLRQKDGNAWAATSNDSPYDMPTPWNDFSEGVLYNGLQAKSFVDVGTYTVELSPSETWLYADGYWPDGTSGPREYSFDITPATLTATAHDVYIHEGEEPVFSMDVTGFVNGENAGNAKGYTVPVAHLAGGVDAGSLKAGETCEIVVSGGTADNYQFEYKSATLHVLTADTAAVPRAADGLVYSGKEQTGVADGPGYSVETGAAIDAGTYHAVATLDEGVEKWADGGTERERTVEWSIAKAPLKATYLNEIVCRSDVETGTDWPAFRVHVEGFVNGESPANGTVADYVAPTLYEYSGNSGTDMSAPASEWELTFMAEDVFMPAGGSARNYEFTEYERGSLWIVNDGSGIHRAAAPNVTIGLVYSGKEQVGVASRVGSTILAQGSGIDAGTYTATVALDEDRTGWYLGPEDYWYGENAQPDDSSNIIQIQWSIAKAQLSAKAKDVVITYGDIPQLEAEVTGFVNGEDASSAAGYEAPVVSLPKGVTVEDLEPGETYTLSVSGGAAGNYEFASYEPGTLTVLPKGEVATPTVTTGLVYNGKEQRAIAENDAWTVSGATAVNAGDYEATVTLNDGYVWSDGTTDPVTLSWSIAPAELTASYGGGEVAEGDVPEFSVEVSGFVNGESAETAAGYEAPTVSLPDGVTADSLIAGQTYELTPVGGKADNYTFKYAAGTLKVTEAKKTLSPGTYTITANLQMPAEYNPILPVAVYPNNPNNPFSDNKGNAPVLDENDASEVSSGIPMSPLSMNAQLIVGKDGTKTLVLPIKNPVFTTQDLGTCSELSNVKVERVAPADASAWDYGKYDTRIHMMSAELPDTLVDSGTATYIFTGSKLYAVPLDTDLAPSGAVALQLDVTYDGITKVSDSTEVPVFEDGTTTDPEEPDDGTKPGGNEGGSTKPGGNEGGSTKPGGSQGGSHASKPGNVATTSDGHLAAGTYTVSANIWFDKATTGLPLNPHITNGGFPPKDPVSNNATLKVSKSGRATVTIPIRIQDRVMQVKSIKGLNIVDYTTSGGKITSITVDLGVLSSKDTVITKSCQVSVRIGDLAMTIASGIFNGVRDHTWNATFQLNFKGLPASGGGTMPAEALAALSGQDALADEATAEAAALDALDAPASNPFGTAESGAEGAASGNQVGGVPVAAIAVGAIVLLAIIAAAAYAVRRRKSGGM